MCQMLLSINPRFVKSILSGEKLYEYRKFRCREDIEKIIIYATAPEKKVVGEAFVSDIIEGSVSDVWNRTKEYSGVSEKLFFDYYCGKRNAVAYKLNKVIKYDTPLELEDLGVERAPQSYRYIDI